MIKAHDIAIENAAVTIQVASESLAEFGKVLNVFPLRDRRPTPSLSE